MKATKKFSRFTEEDGHQLAADMIRELQAHFIDREQGIPEEDIDDLWQRDDSKILRRYLDTVRLRRSPALERGFFAVLTDFIGAAGDSTVYDPNPEVRHG